MTFLNKLKRPGLVLIALLVAAFLLRREIAAIDGRALIEAQLQDWPLVAAGTFVFGYGLAVALMLPTLWLNVLAGAIWGPLVGGSLALAGSTGGAIAAFLLARAAIGQPLARPANRALLRRLQVWFAQGGWQVIALVRLNPIFPGPVNHLFGLTSIDRRTYVWATAVFLAPPTFLFAAVGHAMGEIGANGLASDIRPIVIAIGVPLAILGFGLIALRLRGAALSDDVR
jgi:uncharacterized membrane protein YdjX (TVP38/TMEM64 family)